MTFKRCSIKGKCFGYVTDEQGNEIEDLELIKKNVESIQFEENEKDFVWFDRNLIESIDRNDEDVDLFFKLLSLCHTVMPEEKNGRILYQAQSPDEFALVSAARSFRYVFQVSLIFIILNTTFHIFQNRTQNEITIRVKDQEETYQLKNILDFSNERQRMSVCRMKI